MIVPSLNQGLAYRTSPRQEDHVNLTDIVYLKVEAFLKAEELYYIFPYFEPKLEYIQ